MQSRAKTVVAYLKELPPERREAIAAVRKVILENVDADIEEGMQYGHIAYYVPHRVFANGYHVDPAIPLPYLALASQKQHMAAYLMFAYMGGTEGEAWIRQAYAKAGRRIDMGKSCLRFRSLKDIDLDILAEAIRRAPTRAYVERYFEMVGPGAWKAKAAKSRPSVKRAAKKATKPATQKAAKKK
jgi:hypothetical protein